MTITEKNHVINILINCVIGKNLIKLRVRRKSPQMKRNHPLFSTSDFSPPQCTFLKIKGAIQIQFFSN